MKIKNIILVILLLMLFIKSFGQINGLWIGTYSSNLSNENIKKRHLSKEQIIYVKNNKLTYLKYNPIYNEDRLVVDSIELQKDSFELLKGKDYLFWVRKIYGDTIRVSFSNNTLTTTFKNIKTTYTKAPELEGIGGKSKIESYLTNSSFDISNGDYEDGMFLKFLPNNRYVRLQLNEYGRYYPYWNIIEIENKYFLFTAHGSFIIFHQVKEYNEKEMVIINFRNFENPEFVIPRLQHNNDFNKDFLIGRWRKKIDNTSESVNESYPDSLILEKEEFLSFNDSIFTIKFNSTIVKSTWELHLNNNIILFPELHKHIRRQQWKIENLTKDKLIVKRRKRETNSDEGFYYEIVEFKKIK